MTSIEDTLDHLALTDFKTDLYFKNGFTFGLGLRITAAIGGLIGIVFIVLGELGYLAGPIFILVAIYTLTSTEGTEISLSNNGVRGYTTSFGYKKGKWKTTHYFTDVCLLKNGLAVNYETFEDRQNKPFAYELFLLTSDHRQRFYLTSFDNKKTAVDTAKKVAIEMRKTLKIYQPTISERTRQLRYERH